MFYSAQLFSGLWRPALVSAFWGRLLLLTLLSAGLLACGSSGSGSGSGGTEPPVNNNNNNNGTDDPPETVTISGVVTYDLVPPHTPSYQGLDYTEIEARPARGVVVELLDSNDSPLDSTKTDDQGNYSLQADADTQVRVQVKARLLRETAPIWDKQVTDNTSNNALYVMQGQLASSGSGPEQQRDLHADSGWTGSAYTQPRTAAPFAILDFVYTGLQVLAEIDGDLLLPPLELRWSPNNRPAGGELEDGDIGTSFYDGQHIYLLGDEDVDTDEYDSSVVVHEWGHYLEAELFRADSMGGNHGLGDSLDMRVAFSEGFANAFSGMMLDTPIYWDSLFSGQSDGFFFDLRETEHTVRGWYSESSVESVFYNYFDAHRDGDFTSIYQVMHSDNYRNSNALASIFLFSHFLAVDFPEDISFFSGLLDDQNINSMDQFGADETNGGSLPQVQALPVYKPLQPNAVPGNVCSSSEYGAFNKLGVFQFLRLPIAAAGSYTITMEKSGGDSDTTDPDFFIYRNGNLVEQAEEYAEDEESLTLPLVAGEYLIEAYDYENMITDGRNSCFDISVQQN